MLVQVGELGWERYRIVEGCCSKSSRITGEHSKSHSSPLVYLRCRKPLALFKKKKVLVELKKRVMGKILNLRTILPNKVLKIVSVVSWQTVQML